MDYTSVITIIYLTNAGSTQKEKKQQKDNWIEWMPGAQLEIHNSFIKTPSSKAIKWCNQRWIAEPAERWTFCNISFQ